MPKATKKKKKKGTRKPKTTTRVNKSAWIRNQPPGMPAKDVVAKAKGEGIKLSISQVYTARSSAKKAARTAGAGRGKAGVGRAPARAVGAARRSAGGDDELAFTRLVMSIGLERAEAYMAEMRRSVGL